MPETIGKYRIVERIGRGGMGMIFKAHDPVLDRLVALKVISTDVEVTEEQRTRFFQEAKACAKLNHPNIVTVHEMGEDAGRLFIVMELLEGDELRHFIKIDTSLTLEDKLSVMLQVCRGLHYAHQKGIVHRDMKPGNIFVLRTGQVKILDFGIAHITTTDAGLTRTGLIMGTLRYMSPEQVRGRVDHRSDMFSIGAVFYELLTAQPPFLGNDAIHLLEQLRTEEPPALTQVDPTIPPELAAAVHRALRKDPAERFRDLEEMASTLELVRGGVIKDGQRVLARVRRQREQLARLQTALADRVGSMGEEAPIAAIAERDGLVAARAAEREFGARITALEAKIDQADALAPAVARAQALLDSGHFEDAARQFESIVAAMPDHGRAGERLGQARTGRETQRQRQLAADVLQKARAALAEGRHALCLEILKPAAEMPLPQDVAAEMASLRETTLAGQEALRRDRHEADEGRERMSKRRSDAQAEDAAEHAPGLWKDAEALAAQAEGASRREAHAEARQGFERAAEIYGRSVDAARQGQSEERQAAQRARDMATQGQHQAQASEASQYAREIWDTAEARSAEAQAAFAAKAWVRAGAGSAEAAALYRRAADAAREARERERRRAEAARERAAEARRRAEAMDAEHRAASTWSEAVAKSAGAEAALLRKQYAKATEYFGAALALYHHAQTQVGEIAPRQREQAEQRRREMAERRRGALAAEASTQATSEWNEAEASAAAGEEALAREAWPDALRAFEQAASLYRRAEQRARDTLHTRLDAEQAVSATERARRVAAEAGAATRAPEPWKEAQRLEARAVAVLSQEEFAAAGPLFGEAARLYAVAAQSAGVATEPPATSDDDATVLAAAPTIKPIRVAPDVPKGGQRETPRGRAVVADAKPETRGPLARPSGHARPWARAVVAAVGVLGVTLIGLAYWRSHPSPPVPHQSVAPSPPPATPAPPPAAAVAPPASPSAEREAAERPQAPAIRAREATATAAREPSRATPSAADRTKSTRRRAETPAEVVAKGAPPEPATVTPLPPAPPTAADRPGPLTIRKSLEDKLQAAGFLRRPDSDGAGVAVEEVGADGSVKLVGVLKDGAARQAAADLIRGTAGVSAVDVRRVTVQSGWTTK